MDIDTPSIDAAELSVGTWRLGNAHARKDVRVESLQLYPQS